LSFACVTDMLVFATASVVHTQPSKSTRPDVISISRFVPAFANAGSFSRKDVRKDCRFTDTCRDVVSKGAASAPPPDELSRTRMLRTTAETVRGAPALRAGGLIEGGCR